MVKTQGKMDSKIKRVNATLLISSSIGKFSTGGLTTDLQPGNTKGGRITVPLTSCLTGLEAAV